MAKSKISLTEELLTEVGTTPFKKWHLELNDYVYMSSHTLLLEGIDFNLVYTPLLHLGYKAALSAFGPLYAGCFNPVTLSVKIGLSGKFDQNRLKELWKGITAAVKEHGVEDISLDLQSSLTGLSISLASEGKQKRESFVQRRAVASGDLLCIDGSLGAAYIGLQILEREKSIFEKQGVQPKLDNYKFVLGSFLNPRIDKELCKMLQSAQISPPEGHFVTNGLSDGVLTICARNNLGAKIFLDRIPVPSQVSEVARELNIDPVTAALNGGEDFRLLFCVPVNDYEKLTKELPQLDIIGHLCDVDAGANLITPDGGVIPLKAQGWNEVE